MQLLLCPILDHAGMTESRRLYAKGYFLDQATLDDDVRHYVATGRDLEDPRISPLRAPEVHGLPPTLIHSAQCDPLRDEAAHYAQRLQAAGVPVTLTCHAGMIHLFYALAGVIPAAKAAVEAIGTELQALLCKD